MEDIIARLSEPIPVDKVKNRRGDGGGTVYYIERATVIDRLNEVLGTDWSFSWELMTIKDSGDWIVKGTVTIYGEQRSDIGWGENKLSEKGRPVFGGPEKAAVSDALKRAASQWGVGSELYEDDYHPNKVQASKRAAPRTIDELWRFVNDDVERRLAEDSTKSEVLGEKNERVWKFSEYVRGELCEGSKSAAMRHRYQSVLNFFTAYTKSSELTVAQLEAIARWIQTDPARAKAEAIMIADSYDVAGFESE